MLFSSLTFVWFFLPALALIYYICLLYTSWGRFNSILRESGDWKGTLPFMGRLEMPLSLGRMEPSATKETSPRRDVYKRQMECVPMQEAGKVPRPRPGPRQKPRHKPRLRHRPRPRHKPRRRPRPRTRLRPGQLPGQKRLPVLRAGIRMGYTGTISARTEPV